MPGGCGSLDSGFAQGSCFVNTGVVEMVWSAQSGQRPSAAGPLVGAPDATEPEADATRRRVARSILQHGPSTAADLADRLGLTSAAVRRHLSALELSGELTTREQRVYGARGRGRPARVFVLTDAGRQTFDTAYDDLAIKALDYLARRVGPGAIVDFAEESLAPVEARFGELDSERDRAERVVEAFNDAGYAATLKPLASGQQLCQHHCPVAHVARAYPAICLAETRLLSKLLGSHVQRLATIASGDEVCTTHIPHPVAVATEERKSS